MWSEFKAFLIKDNVIGLAIAVILGVALNAVIGSVVNDLIMPLVGLVLPSGDWQTWAIQLNETSTLKIGSFLGAVVNFLIIGFVLWRMSKIFVKPKEG